MKYKVISASICLAIIILQPTNKFVESFFHFGYAKAGFVEISMPVQPETEVQQETTEPGDIEHEPETHVPTFDLSDVQKGQTLAAGFVVTSLQGQRKHPVHGTIRWHNGVDVALSAGGGEPLFAPEVIDVQCKVDTGGGGGHYAEFGYAGFYWQLLHLQADSCIPGRHTQGSIIGRIGNTGTGTGNHLHLQGRLPGGKGFVAIKKGHLEAVLVQQGG